MVERIAGLAFQNVRAEAVGVEDVLVLYGQRDGAAAYLALGDFKP